MIQADVKMDEEMKTSPRAEPCRDWSQPAWFCIRTQVKREHIAAAHLGKVPDVEVFNPQLRLLKSTRQGPRWRTESLFPNYLFARFRLDSSLENVRYSPSVKRVVQFGDQVPEIADAVIEELRRGMAGLDSEVLTDAPLEGEEVEIARGAFCGMKGRVTRVLPGSERARILLDMVGRPVPVELSLDLVLFDRRDAARMALKRCHPARADDSTVHDP
jgi:transcriptional antiterminator RfaH